MKKISIQPIHKLMTKENLVTAKMGTTLEEAKKILQKHRIEKLPVVDSKGKLKGLITIKDIEKAKNYPQATGIDTAACLWEPLSGSGRIRKIVWMLW